MKYVLTKYLLRFLRKPIGHPFIHRNGRSLSSRFEKQVKSQSSVMSKLFNYDCLYMLEQLF
jgi:hypothetical protein